MGSSGRIGACLAAAGAGAGAALAWTHGFWATFAGCVLVLALLLAAYWRGSPGASQTGGELDAEQADAAMLPILLDQLSTPLVRLDEATAYAMNRAARQLFGTDDRILPAPAGLFAADTRHIRHEGRLWRVDRVEAPGTRFAIVLLIDVEAESRAAEARASSEMIEILGHELLNGLSPIVSLADSAQQVMLRPDRRDAMLPDILGTLSRRAEGLMRFTASYRALARLPEPQPVATRLDELAADMQRQFALKWGDRAALIAEVDGNGPALFDRDQMVQAIWALLNNGAEAALAGRAPAEVRLLLRQGLSGTTIDVEDSGDGVSPEQRDRIFRPFFTTRNGGSGIGLTLARQIARAHGGELTLRPEMPTLFRIWLPPEPGRLARG